jgi:hypothetical protein
MIKIRNEWRNQGQPEGCISDIVAYTPKIEGYPTVSDMNELGAMPFDGFIKKYGINLLNKRLNSFNGDVRFAFSVLAKCCPETIVILKHMPDNKALSHLMDYIIKLINPSKDLRAQNDL